MDSHDKNITVPFNWDTDVRSKLHPVDAPNPIVWCDRCKTRHRYYTFTQGDYDVWLAKASKDLSDNIDKQLLDKFNEGL